MLKLTRISKSNKAGQDKESGQRVLYVEDEDVNWEVAELALRSKFQLTRAKTAEEAFSHLSKTSFDLILMDIQLMGSDLNGIEITQILRRHYDKEIPSYAQGIHADATKIIFVTAYSARYGKNELLAAGGDDLMTKPVDFTRLSLVMSRMVARDAYQDTSTAEKPDDRRQSPRVDFKMQCQVECAEFVYRGTIFNVSMGGAHVQLRTIQDGHPLKVGGNVQLTFETAWGKLAASAKVLELNLDKGELRLEFGYIPPASKELLENWLKESEPSTP